MALPTQNTGGSNSAPNRAPAQKVIVKGLANTRVGNQVYNALQGTWNQPAMIVATSTSSTTNFGALLVGDIVIHIPATAGNSTFYVVTTAGTLPAAAVVGDLYTVNRQINLDSDIGPVEPLV